MEPRTFSLGSENINNANSHAPECTVNARLVRIDVIRREGHLISFRLDLRKEPTRTSGLKAPEGADSPAICALSSH